PFIHGRITSQSAEPVPDALVLLEMNGVYKYGATTNAVGDFEFLEVPEGSYQLKVYHPAYRLREYTGTQYRNGMEYNFQIGLKDIQSQRPVYEFLHSDYRLSLFCGRNQSNRMQVAVYDKESRQPIQQVQIQVFRDGHEVYGVNTFSSNTSEWSTPSDEATPYQIRISKPGYTSLTLNNIHFIQDDFFLLNVFLAPFDERIPVYSKYYTTNLSDYVQQAQENRSSTAEVSEASADGRVRIEGILLDENKHPVRGVNVSLLRDHWVHSYVITDARGYFSIQDIPEGEYQLRISAWGYETQLLSELQIRSKKKLFIRCTLVETEMTIAMGAAEGPVVNEAPLYYAEEALSKNASMNAYATAPMGSYTLDQGTAMREIQFAPAMVQSYEVSADGIEAFSALPGRGDVKPRSISQLDESALKEFVNQGNGSVTRSRFSDVGFWQPNLITNKKGKAQFLVKLPDNITTWKTQWVAMGKHRLHGQDSTETKVFKPIQTQVNFPSYLYR
ncbi:MAG TPA: carboxypeptidase regulatory-like domain-containing protein, partial [Chitinophagaceae bacterium]|nr:carboxypeptidase regulatory-like domain-containing protein [Chitinophagaceae bacterium]